MDREPELRAGRQQDADVGQRRSDCYGGQCQTMFRTGQRRQRLAGHHIPDGHDVLLVHRALMESHVPGDVQA